MPRQTYLEFSYDHIGWENVMQLMRASRIPGGMLDISKHRHRFYISTRALRSEVSRPAWISEARELGLSDVFIAIAMHAAEQEIGMICAGLDAEMDSELPIQPPGPSEHRTNERGDRTPSRYLVCDGWGHIFHDRYGEETVRWIADWSKLKFIKVQIYDHRTRRWEDATDYEYDDVVESLEQNEVLVDPEEFELLACDELPEWGH